MDGSFCGRVVPWIGVVCMVWIEFNDIAWSSILAIMYGEHKCSCLFSSTHACTQHARTHTYTQTHTHAVTDPHLTCISSDRLCVRFGSMAPSSCCCSGKSWAVTYASCHAPSSSFSTAKVFVYVGNAWCVVWVWQALT